MKIVVQRVASSKVEVGEEVIAKIGKGLLLLVCIEIHDNDNTLKQACSKISKLRIFEDEQQKMNLTCAQAQGEVLAVSQFTLSWNAKKGNRPSFDNSMEPILAKEMFERFCSILRAELPLQEGQFAADMQVSLVNDGPVTFSLSF